MLKLIGSIIIILSGTMIGFAQSNKLIEKKELLYDLKNTVMLLRGEIRYSNSVMGQAFSNISAKIKEPFKTFLLNCSKAIEQYDGQTLSDIWNEEIDNTLSKSVLDGKHIEKLKELGKNLGFLDLQMQLSYIDKYIEELDNDIKENEVKIKDNCKLYKTFGIMGGILVVIIII